MFLSIDTEVQFLSSIYEWNTETNLSRRKWNILIEALVKNIKYKKIIIDHDIQINVFSNVTVSYITVPTDDVLNTTNNET